MAYVGSIGCNALGCLLTPIALCRKDRRDLDESCQEQIKNDDGFASLTSIWSADIVCAAFDGRWGWTIVMKRPVLPVFYYLDHFTEMLSFVEKTYGSILTDEHLAFVVRFNTLSRDAQCLLIRMINRRGSIFNREHLKYAEIGNVEHGLRSLENGGHTRSLTEHDYAAFVTCLPKSDLATGAKNAGFADARSSWSKPKLIEFYLANIPFPTASAHCGGDRFVALDGTESVEFLLYLYFGKTEDDLKNFALRDLGIMRTNKMSSFSARFTDGGEARACFYYSRLLDRLASKRADVFRQAIGDILGGPPCATEYASDFRSRAAFQVGQFFEKQGDVDLARQLYRAGSSSGGRRPLRGNPKRCCYEGGWKNNIKHFHVNLFLLICSRMFRYPIVMEGL